MRDSLIVTFLVINLQVGNYGTPNATNLAINLEPASKPIWLLILVLEIIFEVKIIVFKSRVVQYHVSFTC